MKAAMAHSLSESDRLDDNADERMRALAAGARIGRAVSSEGAPIGPLRAWPGGVACTRSIGDSDCGSYIDPTPHVVTRPFPAHGGAVVLASDGVWDALPQKVHL